LCLFLTFVCAAGEGAGLDRITGRDGLDMTSKAGRRRRQKERREEVVFFFFCAG